MAKRLAPVFFVAMFFVWSPSPPAKAQSDDPSGLKGISAVSVMVEDLRDNTKALGLSKDAIQTDVELKLRLAGIRVVTQKESFDLPGAPFVYVNVNLNENGSASIEVELKQVAILQRNNRTIFGVSTWDSEVVGLNPTAQDIRDRIKDLIDKFLKPGFPSIQRSERTRRTMFESEELRCTPMTHPPI